MLGQGDVDRVLRSVLADEIGRLTGRAVPAAEAASWARDMHIDEDGLGLDSLARLEAVGTLNRMLHLHETGLEDFLLVRPTLGEWGEICTESLRRTLGPGGAGAPPCGRLSFTSSGSTGARHSHVHELRDLLDEVDGHAALLSGVRRVLCLVPVHHIYGFLFGVLLPWRTGLAVEDGRAWAPGGAAARARAGDVVVATPFLWSLAFRSGAAFPDGVTALTSGAAAPAALWPAAEAAGLGRLVEIYGSTETAGLGWRDSGETPFALLRHLARGAGDAIVRRRDGARVNPPDTLDWLDGGEAGRAFRVVGRRDGALQVGGVNVHPERVRAVLRQHPGVADCAVRLDPRLARLKAFVVPAEDAPAPADDALRRHCAAHLRPPERPVAFTFGRELPHSEIGKPADWT